MTNIQNGSVIPQQQSQPQQQPIIDMREMIQSTPTTELIQTERVAGKFQQLFAITHPGITAAESAAFYEAEKFHFLKLINESASIAACDKLSLYGIFMDVAVNGLSFDPTFKHMYVVPFNINTGTQAAPKWVKRAALQISGLGELLLRVKQGQIKHADNPVLVYEGDEFQHGMSNNVPFLNHIANTPPKTNNIIACYVRMTRTDGSVDVKVITGNDMARFREFSKDPNSKAWVAGEGGMWIAKCIKHAFKTYPKVRTGKFSGLASNIIDEHAQIIPAEQPGSMNVPSVIEYGFDNENPGSGAVSNMTPTVQHEPSTPGTDDIPEMKIQPESTSFTVKNNDLDNW